jgi:hypothetical protein
VPQQSSPSALSAPSALLAPSGQDPEQPDPTTAEACDDEAVEVDWLVQRVVDPAGGGADFAHTLGLARLGLPELHVWARPTLGDDPGADWMLTGADQQTLLNRAAARLVRERLGPGTEWVEHYDGDLTRARFRVGRPVPARTLDAYRLDGEQPVLPLRFSLHRPEEGALLPLDDRTAQQVDGWTRRVRAHTDHLRAAVTAAGLRVPIVPAAWRLPPASALGDQVDVDPEQPFGPLHALVAARATQLVVADPHTLAEFVLRVSAARSVGITAGAARAVLLAACRPVGRRRALTRALESGSLVLEQVTGRSRVTRRWREACLLLGGPPGGRTQRGYEAGGREELLPWVEVTMATEVLADVLSEQHLALGRGPWSWAVHTGGGAPDTLWQADPEPVDRVVGLLAGWTVDDAERLLDRFRDGDRTPFTAAAELLSGCCTVGRGSPPAGLQLLPGAVRDGLGTTDVLLCEHLARTLVSALVFRDRLPPGGWDAVAGLFGDPDGLC